MIRDFETWHNSLAEASQLEELRGLRVGIEAANFLDHRMLNHSRTKEPLVSALGGLPLGFQQHIEEDLDKFASLQIQPFFVFSGLDVSKQDDPFRQRQDGAVVNSTAWQLYDRHEAEKSVAKFGESPYVTPEDLFRALQSILSEKKIDFMVAPYSAWAQLVYLQQQNTVQAISGASELLLFESDKVITSWDLEDEEFRFIRRAKCVADLRKYVQNAEITDEIFVDACLLAGTHFLPTLPNLDAPTSRNKNKLTGAIEMIMSQGRTGHAVVMNNRDDPLFQRTNYVDRYRKARLAVKHHPILTIEGTIEPLLVAHTPNDSHEFIGQRLPDEVHYYQSRGLINSRVLGWRATSEIVESPPVDGGEGHAYRELVSSKLTPLRTTAINLLSSSLHNWYQHKDIDLKCWFKVDPSGKHQATTISMKGLPEWRKIVDTWCVKESTFKDVVSKFKPAGHLSSAVLALQDADFVTKSVSKKDVKNPLSTDDEILYNSIWRFLALREYVDANHNLTAWGKVLQKTMAALKGGNPDLEEAVLVAIELMRLGVLNSDLEMFPYNGAPMRGELRDRQLNLLVSRVAGLGKLLHNAIGFTGPLSQHLLAYGSIINVVRQTLRDMVEVAATNLLLGGAAERKLSNLSALSIKLPFLLPLNCALSIAVKSYLDELYTDANPTAPETKARVRETAATRYFPQSQNLVGDLAMAFSLWDAVYEGVKSAEGTLKESERKMWSEADEWLAKRR